MSIYIVLDQDKRILVAYDCKTIAEIYVDKNPRYTIVVCPFEQV